MGTRENKVETYLKAKVETIGGITRKWVSPGRDGVPDQIVFLNSIILVEVKTIDGVLEPHQRREHNKLIEAGAEVVTVYGMPGVDKFLLLHGQGFIFKGEDIR